LISLESTELERQAAIVMGGPEGLGEDMAGRLLGEGAKVVLSAINLNRLKGIGTNLTRFLQCAEREEKSQALC